MFTFCTVEIKSSSDHTWCVPLPPNCTAWLNFSWFLDANPGFEVWISILLTEFPIRTFKFVEDASNEYFLKRHQKVTCYPPR